MNFECSKRTHTITLNSTGMVNKVCQKVMGQIDCSQYSKDDCFGIHLSLEEALTNAIKHGNKNNKSKSVTLKFSISPEKVDLFIEDQGSGFDPDSIPDPREEKNLCKVSGRGLLLMKSYMDFVEFNQRGNIVHMVKFSHGRDH